MGFRTTILGLGLGLVLGLTAASSAHAYDIDVHFYQTYSMARYAGLKHEAAALIAASAQWPDETAVVASPYWEFKSRRLFHFPCFATGTALEGNAMGEKTDKDESVDKARAAHVQFCETREDNEMAYLLMYEGLCHGCDSKTNEVDKIDALKGDLLKAATSLHTIEDSYAHEGTPSEIGHAAYGHWPDRAYNPDGSVQKVYRMIGSAMYGIVALRETLGGMNGKWCDQTVRDPSRLPGLNPAVPNCHRSAEELALGYRSLPILRKTIEHYVLTDRVYVEHVMNWALQKMQDIQHSQSSGRLMFWLNPVFDSSKWLYSQPDAVAMMRSGKHDVYAVMHLIFPRLYKLEAKDAAAFWKPLTPPDSHTFVVSKYALLANLFWLDTPDPKVQQYDAEIHQADRDIRQAMRGNAAKGKKPFSLAAGLSPQVLQMMKDRNQKQEQREELRLTLVKNFEKQYYEDPTHSFDRLMNDMIETMLYTNVPRPLNAEHRFEYENDNAYPRMLELMIRVNGVREMIQALYGTNVRFVSNNVDWAFSQYQREHPDQTKDFTNDPDWLIKDVPSRLKGPEALVTFNYRQINLWNEQMIRFTFPLASDLFAQPGQTLVDGIMGGFIRPDQETTASDTLASNVMAAVSGGGAVPAGQDPGTDGGGQKIKFKLSLKAAGHLSREIFDHGGFKEAWGLGEKDYLTTHVVAPIEMTAKIKNYAELKQLVDTGEFKFSAEQMGFLENLDGSSRSFIKDPTPQAGGLLRQEPTSSRRLP